jgi:hypothetical protein
MQSISTPDLLCYLAQFVAGAVYVAVLELVFKRSYEPDYTWVTVVWGTLQTGMIVAARLALAPAPALPIDALVWWSWWLWTWSFAAAGLPVVFWQVVLQGGRGREVVDFVRRWNERYQ